MALVSEIRDKKEPVFEKRIQPYKRRKIVGREKNEQIVAEDRWNAKARNEKLLCEVCGRLIEYDEREVFFSTRRCSTCENTYEKFERED